MDLNPRPQYIGPNMSQDTIQFKVCNECLAKLPISHFSLNKLGKHGYHNTCRDCRAQGFRTYRRIKYNSKSQIEEDIIRSVSQQNKMVLDQALQQPKFQCIGFVPHSNKIYRVHFGESKYNVPGVALFPEDGSKYHEYLYMDSDVEKIAATIHFILKQQGIRLELSEADMINSKTILYYL